MRDARIYVDKREETTDGMKIAITGSSGFVGKQVSRRLAEAGHELYLYDIQHPSVLCDGAIFPIIGNLASGEGLDAIPWDRLDVVLQLAAAGVKASRRTWTECLQVNVIGTQRLLEQLRESGNAPRLVYARTFYENHMDVQSIAENPYVATKRTASELIGLYQQEPRHPCTSLTLYQVYGPGDSSGSVLSYIVNQLHQNQPALLGSGRGLRDWIYIDDLVEGLVAAATAPAGDYDLGTGNLHSLKKVALKIADIMGSSRELLVFDPDKDRGDTGIVDCATRFVPGVQKPCSLSEGLRSLVTGFLQNLK